MIWIICFLLSLMFFLAAVICVCSKKYGSGRLVIAMGFFLVSAYVVYIPQYFGNYEFFTALLGGFINLLQIISLDADFLGFRDFVCESTGNGLFTWLIFFLMGAIHLALPAISAATAFTIVANWLGKLRMGIIRNRKNNLYVFSEINENTLALAKDIRNSHKKADMLFFDNADSDETTDLRKRIGFNVIQDSISEFRVFAKKRKVYIYCMSANENKNMNSFLDIMADFSKKTPEEQQNIHVFLDTTDPSAELIVDSLDKGFVSTTLINDKKMAVYSLLERYPMLKFAKDKKISVLICGFSETAQEALKAVTWCGQLDGYSLSVKVAAKNIRERKNDFKGKYPGLFSDRYDICFYEYEDELSFSSLLSGELNDCNYIIIAEDDEVITVEHSVKVRRAFYSNDPAYENCPPVFAYISDTEKAAAVSKMKTPEVNLQRRVNYDIIPFGIVSEIYTVSFLSESRIEQLAKNVHLVYEDVFSQGEIDPINALKGYNTFEVNKNASISNALHIRYKLLMLGLDYTDDENADEVDFKEYLSDETILSLSVAEHNRWMAFLESEGWTEASLQQVNAYKTSGLSRGRHNCPVVKMHPYICDFDELPVVSEKLGLPDATKSDICMIERIPDILGDKWNISGKKYKIVRNKNTDIKNKA